MSTNMITSNPDTLWATHGSEECEEADEPPELRFKRHLDSNNFQKTTIRRSNENSSLLTKAIMGNSDDDLPAYNHSHEISRPIMTSNHRRRSLASNISLASTADLTSDTGLTSPSRPNTPSPPPPEMAMLHLDADAPTEPKQVSLLGVAVRLQGQQNQVAEAPRKRSIQFACGGKPVIQEPTPVSQAMVKTPSAQEAPRRPCIKFACPARPASTQNTPPQRTDSHIGQAARHPKPESPSTPKRSSTLAAAPSTTPRQITPRRHSMSRPKFLRANSTELSADGSHFVEFASGTTREEDWIRQEHPVLRKKLTIDDTLTKENRIRRLAAEAEEEEEEEEEELNDDEDAIDDDDEDEDEDELEVELDDDEDDENDDDSDGYHTDEETGFADSDDDDDDDENMALWTPSQKSVIHGSSAPTARRMSIQEPQSDSSIASQRSHPHTRRERARRIKSRDETPDLPDSTDFVCGTLDEDRPLEEAYMSCLAARRNEKLRMIPQDIDPSFPASEPEEENDGEIFNPVHHESDVDDWLHGKMEDIHHGELDRPRRRRKSIQSPKRYRSPAPKRHFSPPPPKARGRSPKPLFDRPSPRKTRSPGRNGKQVTTPLGSPRCGQVKFNLAGRPGLTHTKSLPRAGIMFLLRQNRTQKTNQDHDVHIRGAIDIVKGLESKRQRRKEKFHSKYCNRARRGQLPEHRPMPGRGAERMKELGLLMAGKKDQGNYVISV
ncbi:hypothetical protein AK830_g3955 [Neonectria ditissima]|uniref:Extensin domain-containing protein n=1 Tax=Neonectria ditissima TaxID=78410 RepID=A0A0P7BP31_9HYPO|nr:hypothetical protein AK830_g3955 [Neonectria ditissima]